MSSLSYAERIDRFFVATDINLTVNCLCFQYLGVYCDLLVHYFHFTPDDGLWFSPKYLITSNITLFIQPPPPPTS